MPLVVPFAFVERNRSRVRESNVRTCGTSAAAPIFFLDIVFDDVDGVSDDRFGNCGRSPPHGTSSDDDDDV